MAAVTPLPAAHIWIQSRSVCRLSILTVNSTHKSEELAVSVCFTHQWRWGWRCPGNPPSRAWPHSGRARRRSPSAAPWSERRPRPTADGLAPTPCSCTPAPPWPSLAGPPAPPSPHLSPAWSTWSSDRHRDSGWCDRGGGAQVSQLVWCVTEGVALWRSGRAAPPGLPESRPQESSSPSSSRAVTLENRKCVCQQL